MSSDLIPPTISTGADRSDPPPDRLLTTDDVDLDDVEGIVVPILDGCLDVCADSCAVDRMVEVELELDP